jgi:hypothetical protein
MVPMAVLRMSIEQEDAQLRVWRRAQDFCDVTGIRVIVAAAGIPSLSIDDHEVYAT